VLAAEIPSLENGGVARDGLSVTWKLKPGVTFHDGQPFTAEDVAFTYEYANDPATAATTRGDYTNIERVEVIDKSTVKLVFKEPTPIWNQAFISGGHIFPKHLIDKYKGAESRNSPYNLRPVGTGPYKIVDFRPGDVITAEINPTYHVPNRPFFDKVELKGGGDAPAAARAVLQTGEMDYAWNLVVEPDILADLVKNNIGRIIINNPGSGTEHIQLNFTDPNVEVDGERSSLKTKHPFFSDLKVRQAVALSINRKLIVDELYGDGGVEGIYMVYNPRKFMPENGKYEFNLQKAAALLEEAGWRRSGSGVRTKDGKPLKVLFQTSVSPVRQKTQAIIKKDMESIGFEVELKSVISDVFFSNDAGNPDTLNHFTADLQMYNTGPGPDPQTFWQLGLSTDVAQKANKFAGRNKPRYQNPDFDRLWNQARVELDPVKRADLLKKINQLMVDDVVLIPVVNVNGRGAAKNNIKGVRLSAFDSTLWNLPFWYRE
jgi:peptide/nickel transport system substrate-binding protein